MKLFVRRNPSVTELVLQHIAAPAPAKGDATKISYYLKGAR